ncbi:MAG: FHA domain-containing protein [Zavarzinella sp.]
MHSKKVPFRPRPITGELVVRNGPKVGARKTLLLPCTRIGTAETCDLRILDDDVRQHHCVISVTPDGPLLDSLGGTTLVNGDPVNRRILLSGDFLTIGQIILEVFWYHHPAPEPEHQYYQTPGKKNVGNFGNNSHSPRLRVAS